MSRVDAIRLDAIRLDSMREDEPPEEASEAMKGIRAWRATERKKMVESMDKLLAQAQKLATSQYTRSAERSKWTRLAGQLLWYKDQILRAMTWEAIERDFNRLERDVYEDRRKQQRPTWQRITPAPFVPTLVKKREEDQDVEKDMIPEVMREEEVVVDKSSSAKGGQQQEEAVGTTSREPSPEKEKEEDDDAQKASSERS